MTTTNVLALFDILQDTYGAPYFPDAWKIRMFNQCQYTYLNDLFPDNQGGRINVEQDSNTLANLKTLIYNLSINVTSGQLNNSDINAALVTASGEVTAKIFRLMALGVFSEGVTYPIRFLKHNDNWSFNVNSFKSPRFPDKVKYTQIYSGFRLYPTDTAATTLVTVMKAPRDISLSPNVDPEFETDYPVYAIIAKMLKLSGVPVNDQALIQNVQAAAISQ